MTDAANKAETETVLLRKGDIIELTRDHCVYAMIPEHLVYSNRKGVWSLTRSKVKLADDFYDYLRGEYAVINTKETPPGTGHGAHDIYPGGHLVTCQKLGEDHQVEFYQTGCFDCVNRDIVSTEKAEIKYVRKP